MKISKEYIKGLKDGLKIAKNVAKKYGLNFEYPSINKIMKNKMQSPKPKSSKRGNK